MNIKVNQILVKHGGERENTRKDIRNAYFSDSNDTTGTF